MSKGAPGDDYRFMPPEHMWKLARVIDGRHPEEVDAASLVDDARKAFRRLRLLPEGQMGSSRRGTFPQGEQNA